MIGKRDAVGCWTRFEGLEPVLVNGRRKSDETDPDRLHDLLADLDGAQVHYPD